MKNFSVSTKELLDTVRTWRLLEGYVAVRLGPATFESALRGAPWNGLRDNDIGIVEIEIYEVRHLRVQTLSQEVLLRLGFLNWVEIMNEHRLNLDSEITIIFFRRSS